MPVSVVSEFECDDPVASDGRRRSVYGVRVAGGEFRYVGQTSTSLKQRMKEHGQEAKAGSRRPICKWLRAHAGDLVEVVELEVCATADELNCAEVRWIEHLGTHVSHGGLNVHTGGAPSAGYLHSRRTKEELSKLTRGEKNPNAKLTRRRALTILRRATEHPRETYAQIAKRYGVSAAMVENLCRGRTWKDLPRDPSLTEGVRNSQRGRRRSITEEMIRAYLATCDDRRSETERLISEAVA